MPQIEVGAGGRVDGPASLAVISREAVMKRPTAILFVLLLAGCVGLVLAQRRTEQAHGAMGSSSATALARAGARPPSAPASPLDSGLDPQLPAAAQVPAGPGDELNVDAGGVLPGGGSVPELEAEAPKAVLFGVVLVQYADAQGAPPGTRTRGEAQALAAELAKLGKTDFKTAVEKGDPGSNVSAGRMYRGVLEPAPEYVLFSLQKGEVSEPIDTPKGFWVVKRIE